MIWLRFLLNVIRILKEEPRTLEELMNTGLFPRREDLIYQLFQFEKAKIIAKDRLDGEKNFYALTDLGREFLKCYSPIELRKVDVVFNPEIHSYIKLVQPSYPR
jgi:predicted transcriptional regulator